jgi:hypothetical protein
MKALLVALVLFWCDSACGEEYKCPDFYPASEAALSSAIEGHRGSGLVRGAPLFGAQIYRGKLHSNPNGFEAMQKKSPKRVKGGWDEENNFMVGETKWLVCLYGGGKPDLRNPAAVSSIEWWEQIDPYISHCVLQFREIKAPYHAESRWFASALCR